MASTCSALLVKVPVHAVRQGILRQHSELVF